MNPVHFFTLSVAGVACVTDLRTRRIPNVLTFGTALGGLLFQFATGGVGALSTAVLGWLLGAAVFLLPFALNGLGGGDVKLLAALGAWLGPADALWLVLYTGIAGGVMAIVVSAWYGYLGTAVRNIKLLLCHWQVAGLEAVPEITLDNSRGPKLAYAFPILIGLVTTVWLR